LGAAAAMPPGPGRCDSAWRWDTARWLTIEVKSEKHDDGLLPLKDVRRTNTQLASNEGMENAPAGSPSILVSDRLTVAPEHAATANPNVYFVGTNVVGHVADDVAAVWTDLLAASAQQEPVYIPRQHGQDVLTDNGLPAITVMRPPHGGTDPTRRVTLYDGHFPCTAGHYIRFSRVAPGAGTPTSRIPAASDAG
jgi:hypothetical protein